MRGKKERKDSRIRVCARAGDREESENEKKGKEAGKEEEKETKSLRLWRIYVSYVYMYTKGRRERNEMKRRARI